MDVGRICRVEEAEEGAVVRHVAHHVGAAHGVRAGRDGEVAPVVLHLITSGVVFGRRLIIITSEKAEKGFLRGAVLCEVLSLLRKLLRKRALFGTACW